MGRSEGKNRIKKMLLGNSGAALKTSSVSGRVITGRLKELIDDLLSQDPPLKREAFYQDILKDLSKINPSKLLKDPTFLKLLEQENKFLKRDVGFPLNQDNLALIAPEFIASFQEFKTPHLGREFVNSTYFSQEEKGHLINSYFLKLMEKRENPAIYHQFAFENVLTLAQKDGPFQAVILENLAQELAYFNSSRSEASLVIKNLTKEEKELYKKRQEDQIADRLKDFLTANALKSEELPTEEYQSIVFEAKTENVLEAVFTSLLQNKNLLKTDQQSQLASKQDQLDYLEAVFNNTSFLKKDRSQDLVKSIYFLIGGKTQSDLDELKSHFASGSIKPKDVYDALKNSIAGGVSVQNLSSYRFFYDHGLVFSEEISKAFRPGSFFY